MKKRILSLLLAVMMVVTVLVIPASAEGETLPNDYSFKFEDVDARNQTADQVIDFGYKGESKVDIVVDGEIDEAYTTYGEVRTFKRITTGSSVGPETAEVYFAVKDGFLYVAIDSGLDTQTKLRAMPGIFADETSGSGQTRVWLDYNTNGTLTTLASATANKDIAMNTSYKIQQVTTADYMKDITWKAGVFEMKIDIGAVYKLFASWLTDFSWDNPCMTFSFWFLKAGPVAANTLYGIKPADCKDAADGKLTIGSTAVSDFIPYTIIIPEKTVKYVRANYAGVIGAVGTDWRNAIDGQLARVEDYATTAPNVNGTVASNEYTTTHSLPNGITANYAVHGGFLYAAFTYEEATHSAAYFEPFLMSNAGGNHILSRYSMKISTSGSVTVQDADGSSRVQVAEPATLNSLIVETTSSEYFFTSKSASANRKPVTGAKSSHVDGVTTYELKVFIPTLIAMFEYAGWDATEGNCIQYNFMPGDSTENPLQFDLTEAQVKAVSNHSGHRKTNSSGTYIPNDVNGVSSYVRPTVALPKGCTDYYRITDVYDLEPFGQRHVNAGPATAKVDGVVNPSEYTAMKEHKYNSTTPNGYYTGVDYYAQDDEYIYLATVVTHEVDGGTSAFTQFYITPYIDDGIVDVGQNADYNLQIRLNYASNYANGANLHTFGTNNKASRYPQTTLTDEKKAELKGNVEFFVTYKDNVATYEVAIKKSDLSYIFFGDENVEFDKFSVHIFYRGTFSGSNKDGQTKYAMNPNDPYVTLINLTNADDYNNSNRTNYFADVIHMTDFETKNGGSVRGADNYNTTGLRFKTLYLESYIESMKALATLRGETLEIGTVIAPLDYVESVDEFTMEALHAKYGDNGYLNVEATVDSPFEEAGANGIVTYAGSIVNIKEANRDRDFAGIGYIKIGDDIYYSDFYCVRNASDVAKAATEDTKAESDGDKYVNKVINLNGETVYSKYSETTYNNFKALVVTD